MLSEGFFCCLTVHTLVEGTVRVHRAAAHLAAVARGPSRRTRVSVIPLSGSWPCPLMADMLKSKTVSVHTSELLESYRLDL